MKALQGTVVLKTFKTLFVEVSQILFRYHIDVYACQMFRAGDAGSNIPSGQQHPFWAATSLLGSNIPPGSNIPSGLSSRRAVTSILDSNLSRLIKQYSDLPSFVHSSGRKRANVSNFALAVQPKAILALSSQNF